MMGGDPKGWIGVDLDGTLAVDNGQPFTPGHIGSPIPAMLNRVKNWVIQGRDVRIFTARVSSDGSPKRNWEAQQSRHAIEQWCMEFVGRKLPVTCSKDYMMVELWDDRAIQVNRNTGARADGKSE